MVETERCGMICSATSGINQTAARWKELMRRVPLVLAVLLALCTQAFATWSVIAVDRKTGEVVIASATCVPQDAIMRFPALSLKDIQAIIIPGKGVAAAQANVDRTRRRQTFIATELKRGTDPAEILKML